LREFTVTNAQREFLEQRIRHTRKDFATILIGMLSRGRRIEPTYVMRFFCSDPALLGEIPASALRMLFRIRPGKI
jgi:hypothetical protein